MDELISKLLEGKTISEKVRELVHAYIAENDLSSVADDLWDRISKKIKKKGFKELDIEAKNINKLLGRRRGREADSASL